MIKFKHLLALSMTAAFAANASADEFFNGSNRVQFTGEVVKATCVVTVPQEAVNLGKVTTSAFTNKTTPVNPTEVILTIAEDAVVGVTGATGETKHVNLLQ